MRHIDYGLGAFSRQAPGGSTPGAVCDLAEIYQKLLASGELAGCENPERFYEIGSIAGIEDLSRKLGGER